jgi:RimJ/RimL family protein N-acetyltransferase
MVRRCETAVVTNEHWPLFDLEIRTARLTLRYLDDTLSRDLLHVASRGIHDPTVMPFVIPWTDQPSPGMEQEAMRFYARTRADVRPASWNLQFAALVDDAVIGACDVMANDFPALRQFTTGSWLGREFQGGGLGKEMRMAALTLGFDGLGGEFALTSAWHDNAASLGVTRSLGYVQEGSQRTLRRGRPDESLRFRMPLEHWTTIRRDDISCSGLPSVREFLGLSN